MGRRIRLQAFGARTVFGTGNATQVNTITTAIDSALLNYHVISTVYSTCNELDYWYCDYDSGWFDPAWRREEDWTGYRALWCHLWQCFISCLHLALLESIFRISRAVFASIFEGAFHPSAVTGGVIGASSYSLKKGVSRMGSFLMRQVLVQVPLHTPVQIPGSL